MIVLDASVLIAHLESADQHNARAAEILIGAGAEELAASPITLAEVMVGPARAGRLSQVTAALDDLGVATIPLAPNAPARLALLRATTGLQMPDCCVLLAAEMTSAAVATFDERLAREATSLGHDVRR